MRVLVVHNRYRERGGEDVVFESETELLERYGNEVYRLTFDNSDFDDEGSVGAKARLALNTIWSRDAREKVRQVVQSFRPDVAHFHNTFPLASASVYSAVKSQGVAVVQSLHNWRLLCANALFVRDSKPCEACLGKAVPWPAMVHRCYRGSLAHTSVITLMQTVHRARRTWETEVDLFIAATGFAKQKYIAGGLPTGRISIKPHFLEMPRPRRERNGPGEFFLFVGRLSFEKGIDMMVGAWSNSHLPYPLRVVGSGPLDGVVQEGAMRNQYLHQVGALPRATVLEMMGSARALVFPSISYEAGTPLALLEAFAAGLPVIASRLGSMAEVVQDGRTGLLFTPGDESDLRAKVQWAWEHPEVLLEMGIRARQEYEAKYTPERNYGMLMEIYATARGHR